MILKLTGALLILSGCGGYGFYLAASHLREIRTLEKLGRVINAMLWELQFKQTPLPDLCRWTASETTGILRQLFEDLATELDRQVSPNAKKCMYAALAKHPSIPAVSTSILQQLGESLGKFDLKGQLDALDAVEESCRTNLETLRAGQDVRMRSYRTLGICCGAAIVILFI